MKKLVLFFAVAAAMSFAACTNANKAQEEAQPEASQEQIEAPVVEEVPVDSAAVDASVEDAAPVEVN